MNAHDVTAIKAALNQIPDLRSRQSLLTKALNSAAQQVPEIDEVMEPIQIRKTRLGKIGARELAFKLACFLKQNGV
jgi:hypothetical protein